MKLFHVIPSLMISLLLTSPLTLAQVDTTSFKPQQISLDVNLATPVIEANKTQPAFLKVALTGYKMRSQAQRMAANVAIVLDRSGSMSGQKLEQAKEAAILAIRTLSENDIVSIVTYDDSVDVVIPATKVTDKDRIIQKIHRIDAGGSTALFAGVSKGAQEVRKFLDKNKVNRVILLSDGLANVGPQSPTELGQLGMSLAKEGMSISTIGLGLGYNEDLMTQLAGYSDGNHAFVENENELPLIFAHEFGDVLSVVARCVTITIECQAGIKPLEIVGRDGEIIGQTVHVSLNQLYSEQEKYVILKVEIPAKPADSELEVAKVQVGYTNAVMADGQYLSSHAKVRFSASPEAVAQAIDKKTYEDSVEQVATQYKQQAIQLRDEGKKDQAIQVLNEAASYLSHNANRLNSGRLQKEVSQVEEQKTTLNDEQEWNRQRKALKSEVHKKNSQQSY